MACDTGFQEWTVNLFLDTDPSTVDTQLVFCIRFNANQTIDGKAFDTSGMFVSNVTGRNKPFGHANPGGGASLISLEFSMNSVNVTIAGVKLPTRFEGRLRAFGAAELAVAAPSHDVITDELTPAPADGDTGTATGTQT